MAAGTVSFVAGCAIVWIIVLAIYHLIKAAVLKIKEWLK